MERKREARLDAAIGTLCNGENSDRDWRITRMRNNVLRRTRPFRSCPTHFHYPGLVEREFHPRARFPWLPEFERATPIIRAEMEALLASGRAELLPYLQYEDHEALAQWRDLNRNPDWSAIHLLRQGNRINVNAAACPATMALLETVAQPRSRGIAQCDVLSSGAGHDHSTPCWREQYAAAVPLPLVVPPGCWFRVGRRRGPGRKEGFVFDDTIEHEAANPSDRLRVVLIFDLWHPDLDSVEQEAVARIIASDGAV
jgi:aspartyl/asparaginyl beta-hydroxylase (cupin superfamily)